MSIEHGVTSGAPKAAAHAVASPGHGKAPGGPAAAGGFAALLMNLGADEAALEPLPAEMDDDPLAPASGTLESAADAALMAAASPAVSVLGQTALPSAQPSASAAVLGLVEEAVASVPVPAEAAATAPCLQSPRSEAFSAGAGRQDRTPDKRSEDVAPPAAVQPSTDVQPLLRQAALVQRLSQQRAQAADAVAQQGKEQRGEDAAARLGWQMSEPLESVRGAVPGWLAPVGVEHGWRSQERRGEKAAHRSAPGEGGVGASAAVSSDLPRVDVPAAAPDAGLMTEMQVAEQVSIWVSRGVQNAKLELEGPGEGTVNVHISLQGQEARVEFLTDQVQTRQVLEDSMPHLRELLAREGLVLSGMSVGSSGADAAAGRQPQPGGRPGSRQVAVAVPELPAAAGAPTARAGVPGRALDLFV